MQPLANPDGLATRLAHRGVSLPVVSTLLRHGDVATTARIYVHVFGDEQARVDSHHAALAR